MLDLLHVTLYNVTRNKEVRKIAPESRLYERAAQKDKEF